MANGSSTNCCIKGCDRLVYGYHFCTLHYDRWRRHGHPLEVKLVHFGDPVSRFWHYVEKTDTCWLWNGRLDPDGYGRLFNGTKNEGAHRFSYRLHLEQIPPGLVVRHKCDVRNCVNPDHLELGTAQDNTRDRDTRGRGVRGTRSPHSKLTDEQVSEIRRRYESERVSQTALAAEFGIAQVTISKIVRGVTYR